MPPRILTIRGEAVSDPVLLFVLLLRLPNYAPRCVLLSSTVRISPQRSATISLEGTEDQVSPTIDACIQAASRFQHSMTCIRGLVSFTSSFSLYLFKPCSARPGWIQERNVTEGANTVLRVVELHVPCRLGSNSTPTQLSRPGRPDMRHSRISHS